MENFEVKCVESNKQFAIEDCKAGRTQEGKHFIEGYANTKGQADRYGDIPMPLAGVRNYVYELTQFKKNPVLMIDHINSVENIAGSFSEKQGGYVVEDERGLKFKAIFSDSSLPAVAHARTVYSEGHGKALSIGGKWHYENPDNPKQLTLADIFEISIVGIGADADALTTKKIEEKAVETDVKVGRTLSKSNESKIRQASESLAEVLKSLEKEEMKEEEKLCQKKMLRLTLPKKI